MPRSIQTLALCVVLAVVPACQGSDVPSESAGRQVFENRVRILANENGMMRQLPEGVVRPAGFKKTNGQLKDDGGVKRYRLDYEGVVEYLVEIPSSPFNSFRKRNKGDRVVLKKSMEFEMTEKGWRGEDGQIY